MVIDAGGRMQISDISLAKPVSDKARSDPKLWAECVVGAVVGETQAPASGEVISANA